MNEAPRVLIVDDSAAQRAALDEVLTARGCNIVGRAMDGTMALRMVHELDPDVVTCDLEMPRMDGFTFLRIVVHQHPVPVVVVSSDDRPEATLQALELGARDFVVKPSGGPGRLDALGDALAERIVALQAERQRVRSWELPGEVTLPDRTLAVVIGASTGGPRAIRDLIGRLPPHFGMPLIIAQHMPAGFTGPFAARLARQTGHPVAEATDGERLFPGSVRISPGGFHLEVHRDEHGLLLRTPRPSADEPVVPSVDRLFESAAKALGPDVLGVVLTGMGKDGSAGAAALARVGAPLWAESSATAVIDGMPSAAAKAHGHAVRLPLDELASTLVALTRAQARR